MNILCIADIHFGKLNDDDKLYKELKDNFVEYAKKVKPELIVLCGDAYDSRQLINSVANINFNKFIDDCREIGSDIIVLEGTESHDRYQINALLHYQSEHFFIVNTVTKLNLLGMKFLILPEEYVRDEHYYDEYMNDKYDFIFGHGMSAHTGFAEGTSEEIVKKPYIWDAKKLEKICKYYTVFGHIHIHSEYHNFIYCGSFSRLNFGESEPKGFIHINIDKKGKASWKHIENKDAPTMIDVLESDLPDEIDYLLNAMRGYQENNDYVRFVIDQDKDDKLNTIKGFVKNHETTCIKMKKIKKSEEEITENIEEEQKALNDKLDKYKNLSFIEITQKIAEDEYHEKFSQEEINTVLNTQL